jgi:HK97 family phage prohead protease
MPTPEATELRQYAAATFEFRSVEAEGKTMHALVAPYGESDDIGAFTETLRAGVFKKSISQAARSLPLHVMHQHQQIPVGKAVGWQETDAALYGSYLFDTRAEAREYARLAEDGFLSGISVGFQPINTDWTLTGDKPHALRIEARMLETSLCSVPALAGARVLAVRSAGMPENPATRIVPTPKRDEFAAWLAKIAKP